MAWFHLILPIPSIVNLYKGNHAMALVAVKIWVNSAHESSVRTITSIRTIYQLWPYVMFLTYLYSACWIFPIKCTTIYTTTLCIPHVLKTQATPHVTRSVLYKGISYVFRPLRQMPNQSCIWKACECILIVDKCINTCNCSCPLWLPKTSAIRQIGYM